MEKLNEEEEIRRDYDLIAAKRFKDNRLTNEDEINKFKLQFGHLLELKKKPNLSILSVRYLTNALSEYFYLLEENEFYLQMKSDLLNWWEDNEAWSNQSPYFYIGALSNLLAGYGRLEKYDEYLYILKKIEKLKPNNQYEEAMRFHRIMINRQFYFLNKGMIDEVCNLSFAIEKGIKNYKLNQGIQIVLIFNVIVAFFVNKNYKECIKWVKLYDPFKKMEIAKIKIQFAQVLKLIAFYELEDLDQLEKHIRLTQKYFDTQVKLSRHSLDNIILRVLKRLGKVPPKEQFKIIKELDITLRELPTKTKKRIGFDEIDLWVQSKIKDKTIIELIQERNKRKALKNIS